MQSNIQQQQTKNSSVTSDANTADVNTNVTTQEQTKTINSDATDETNNEIINQEQIGKDTNVVYVSEIDRKLVSKAGYNDINNNYASTIDASLASFLSRPVVVKQLTWTVGGSIDSLFSPFDNYLANARVVEKIKNYALLRANLAITFRINGTPFHYGRLQASYTPPKGFTQYTTGGPGSFEELWVNSQKDPVVFLDASNQNVVSMKVPYFKPTDYLSLEYDENYADNLHIQSYDNLAAVSAGATQISITVYAHLEDVELTMLTGHAFVASNEYSPTGMISKPAAAVENFASSLEEVPIIGRFATATKIASNAVGAVASMFGFTKPASVEGPTLFKRAVTDRSANVNGISAIEKLTYDMKQEVTVSNKSVGLNDDRDHMSIKNIANRPTYIKKFTWDTADAPDHIIGSFAVSPTYNYTVTTATERTVYPSSLAFASMPFTNWGGSIKYRLSVVGSAYHRGRIKITYLPSLNDPLTATDYNTNYNIIMDISKDRDIEFIVGMSQQKPFLKVKNYHGAITSDSTISNYFGDSYNGVIFITVVNELSAPVASAIPLLLYASAGPDFTLINPDFTWTEDNWSPTNFLINDVDASDYKYSPSVAFAASTMPDQIQFDTEKEAIYIVGKDNSDLYNAKVLDQYADPVLTFRELVKRWSAYYYDPIAILSVTGITYFNLTLPNFPRGRGTSASGLGDGNVASSTTNGWTTNTVLLSYLSRGFAGWKGGLRYRYYINSSQYEVPEYLTLSRLPKAPITPYVSNYLSKRANASPIADKLLDSNRGSLYVGTSGSGSVISAIKNQYMVEGEVPFHSTYRFCNAAGNALSQETESDQFHRLSGAIRTTSVELDLRVSGEVAAADDFSFFWYIGAPAFVVPL